MVQFYEDHESGENWRQENKVNIRQPKNSVMHEEWNWYYSINLIWSKENKFQFLFDRIIFYPYSEGKKMVWDGQWILS